VSELDGIRACSEKCNLWFLTFQHPSGLQIRPRVEPEDKPFATDSPGITQNDKHHIDTPMIFQESQHNKIYPNPLNKKKPHNIGDQKNECSLG